MLGSQGNESAGRSGVRINKRVGGNGGVIKRARDFFRAIEPAAVSVHFENDRTCTAGFGGLEGATQKSEKRRRNFTANWRDDHVAFMDDFPGLPHFQRRQDRDQNEDR